jgi:hypothetical protein
MSWPSRTVTLIPIPCIACSDSDLLAHVNVNEDYIQWTQIMRAWTASWYVVDTRERDEQVC